MKKPFIYSAIVVLMLAIPVVSHATLTPTKPKVTKPALPATKELITPVAPTDAPTTPVETQVVAQSPNEKMLQTLIALTEQFTVFTTRAKATIDQLSAKEVDTTIAEAELYKAMTSLDTAKANLALVSTPVPPVDAAVDQDIPPITTVAVDDIPDVKMTIQKVQANLQNVRTHVINSLHALTNAINQHINARG